VTIIIGAIAITGVAVTAKIVVSLNLVPETVTVMLVGVIILCAVALGVLSVIFAIKLLSLQDDLNGLLRPYVYVSIAAAICFATFLLAPIGLLLNAASTLILGLIFLRAGREPEVEFV
jgi:hypothetical protein